MFVTTWFISSDVIKSLDSTADNQIVFCDVRCVAAAALCGQALL